jgi:hypothetical protein
MKDIFQTRLTIFLAFYLPFNQINLGSIYPVIPDDHFHHFFTDWQNPVFLTFAVNNGNSSSSGIQMDQFKVNQFSPS